MLYLLDPHDGVIKLRIYGLQVFQCGLFIQHSLVERQREAGVDELPVVQSLWGGHATLAPRIKTPGCFQLKFLQKWQLKQAGDVSGLSSMHHQ